MFIKILLVVMQKLREHFLNEVEEINDEDISDILASVVRRPRDKMKLQRIAKLPGNMKQRILCDNVLVEMTRKTLSFSKSTVMHYILSEPLQAISCEQWSLRILRHAGFIWQGWQCEPPDHSAWGRLTA